MQGIKDRAASDRALLEIQRQRNWLAMEALSIEGEFVGTNAQLLEILGKEAVLQDQIASSRALEAVELSARRVEVEAKIADLMREQRDLLFEQQTARTQEAFGKIGGSEFGQNLGVVSAINAGEDPYTQDFKRWSDLQDQKIMYLEEIGASEQQIKDAYREYDLQQEAMVNQQKVAMGAATFGMLGSLATSLYNMQGKQGGAAFEAMKAFRIGETLMNTYSAAVGAYNALASIPYVGPAPWGRCGRCGDCVRHGAGILHLIHEARWWSGIGIRRRIRWWCSIHPFRPCSRDAGDHQFPHRQRSHLRQRRGPR